MSIQHAILGFLSRSALTGYELKKLFAESTLLPWSGNSNQIYTALVDLHQAGLVSQEIHPQERLPARKVYSITDQGRAVLRQWILSPPELPQLRSPFLVQLAWADQLSAGELDGLLAQYEDELDLHIRMLREQVQRQRSAPDSPAHGSALRAAIDDHLIAFYQHELEWARSLRQTLPEMNLRG